MTGLGGDAVTNAGSVSFGTLGEGAGAHVEIRFRLHTPDHLRIPSPRGQVGPRLYMSACGYFEVQSLGLVQGFEPEPCRENLLLWLS